MKTQNFPIAEKRIFKTMQTTGNLHKGFAADPRVNETNDLHHINLPENKMPELWLEDSVVPVRLEDSFNKPSISISNRRAFYRGNAFEPKPFSEIYNMAVMRDSF